MNLTAAKIPRRIVAVVDDDYRVRESLASFLESAGVTPILYASAEEFLNSAPLKQVGCLITDVRMPGMDGLELQRQVRTERPTLAVLFITAHNDCETKRRALSGGAIGFLCKPFDGTELLQIISRAFEGMSNEGTD